MTQSGLNHEPYLAIDSLSELLNDQQETICIFKHSSTCPISAYAKAQVDSFLDMPGRPPVYMVVVQNERALSNQIAEALKIRHESPQFLVLKGGQAKAVLNHHSITKTAIQAELQKG